MSYNPGPTFYRSSSFGPRPTPENPNRMHYGTDYAAPAGTDIPAAEGGTVIYSGFNENKYGNTVILKHDDGTYTLYAHMNGKNMKKVGESVKKGEKLGEVGNSGCPTEGPHIHYEWIKNTTLPENNTGGPTGLPLGGEYRYNPDEWNGVTPGGPFNWKEESERRTRWMWQFKFKNAMADSYRDSTLFFPRYDPLILDVDGDGIETRALGQPSNSSVYFDFNGDGAKTNTAWISPDDGYLVLDSNNNGTIDNASELFSDYTPLNVGGTAANGFAALAQEDTDKDGVVNNLDANWNNLKIWRDINQDGISQSDELLTMEQAGITGLNVAKTSTNQTLANGNSIKGTGTYIKADGTTGQMADVYFMIDTVNQQFTNTIPVLPEVETLPNMWGSGMVRDLHQAASLSPTLQAVLTQYSQATTRQEQMALIDQLLYAWADTSGMAATMPFM